MLRRIALLIPMCFILWPLVLGPTGAAAETPLQVNAKSAVLMEVNTGRILFEQDADTGIGPASFTKLLTLYLVFQALDTGQLKLEDEVSISERAWKTGGSRMFLEPGKRVAVEDLIKGIAVVSGNDACVAVAEHMAGSADVFVDAMNRTAQEVGMSNSVFRNPHGLPAEGQMTTARDMVTLAHSYLLRFPKALEYHSMKEYTFNKITQKNRNGLLFKDDTVDGLKTGYVAEAGYHLAATAEREGMRLLAVVMGAKSPAVRESEALRLLNYGFRTYTMVEPFPMNQPVATLKVWKGNKDQLSVFLAAPARWLIERSQVQELQAKTDLPAEVSAPIKRSQMLGKALLFVSGRQVATVPLVSNEDIARAGWAKRLWHTVLMIRLSWWWLAVVGGGGVLLVLLTTVLHAMRKRRTSILRRY